MDKSSAKSLLFFLKHLCFLVIGMALFFFLGHQKNNFRDRFEYNNLDTLVSWPDGNFPQDGISFVSPNTSGFNCLDSKNVPGGSFANFRELPTHFLKILLSNFFFWLGQKPGVSVLDFLFPFHFFF